MFQWSQPFCLSCSPLNLQGSIRHSSSSLSSHTSSEAGNLVIMTDGLMGEHPEEALHMQVGVGWRKNEQMLVGMCFSL